MQLKIRILYLSLAIITLSQNILYSRNDIEDTTLEKRIDMPQQSFSEYMGQLTEEQLMQQLKEADEIFKSLSEEERNQIAEITKEIELNMSDEDKKVMAEVKRIVESNPDWQIKEDEIDKLPEKKEENKEKPKKIEASLNNSSVQTLIDSINLQIDDIFNKINSNKDLVAEFSTKWINKFTFDKLKRQILSLKENRLADKLTSKTNIEDKELVVELEEFYKEIVNKNSDFYVEDTFGLPSSNKKQDTQQLKQAKEILTVFDNAIIKLMPKIETFLKKHDPEALEMAKESAGRTKLASDHVKDASVKRGSAPAIPAAPEPVKKSKPTPSDAGQYNQNYYDQYPSYGNYGGGYGNYDYNNMSTSPQSNPVKKDDSKIDKAKDEIKKTKEEPKKEGAKKDDTKRKIEISPYEEAVNIADNFVENSNNSHKAFSKFLKDDFINLFPVADNTKLTTITLKNDWIDQEFDDSLSKMRKLIKKYSDYLKEIVTVGKDIDSKIPTMIDADLKKFAEDVNIKKINERVKGYISDFNVDLNKIADINKKNKSDLNNDGYNKLSDKFFEENLEAFNALLINAEASIKGINNQIKKSQQKRSKKAAAEKKAAEPVPAF